MKTKMKKLLFAIALQCCYFLGTAQTKITSNDARVITANVMANFTESVSFAYKKGISLEQFKTSLCGRALPLQAGYGMIETAYGYLSKGIKKDQIVKENNGVAVANAFKYFLNQHKNGNVIADGSELFGGKEELANNPVAKAADCRWYQFWCLVENFANWVVQNWSVIYEIIIVISGF